MKIWSKSGFALVSLTLFLGGPAVAEEQDIQLLITYQTAAEDRPGLYEYAADRWITALDGWKKDGVFSDYRLLINSYVDDYTWDAMLTLKFDEYGQIRRWNEIERTRPAGLDSQGLEFITPDHTFLANRPFDRRASDADPTSAVYFVIPYAYRSEAEYLRYAQVYVLPQFNGWVDRGIINGYEVLLNRHPTGKPWDALLVIEYRDLESFGQRDDIKWSVRDDLNEKPDWKLISDIKHDFRTEWETVIAEPVRR